MMASDRRYSYVDHRHVKVKDDVEQACKLVFLCNNSVIGFSGFGELEGPTDEWIVKVLAKEKCRTPTHAAEILRLAAPDPVRALFKGKRTRRWQYSHRFVIAGWSGFDDRPGVLVPFVAEVHNNNGMSENFVLNVETKDGEPGFSVTGRELHAENREQLCSELQATAVNGACHPYGIEQCLVRAIQRTHAVYKDEWVGPHVLTACVPKPSPTPSGLFITTEPANGRTLTTAHYRPDFDPAHQMGASLVCGGAGATNFVGTSA